MLAEGCSRGRTCCCALNRTVLFGTELSTKQLAEDAALWKGLGQRLDYRETEDGLGCGRSLRGQRETTIAVPLTPKS